MIDRVHIPLDAGLAPGTWRLSDGQPVHRCPLCKKASAMVNHSVTLSGEVNASIACFQPCSYHVWGILDGWSHGWKLAGHKTTGEQE
jgi:hypothetical protein